MITPLDVACLQVIQAARRVDEAHFHLTDPPHFHPRTILEEATFHITERAVSLKQIGFDYYANVVTYRV